MSLAIMNGLIVKRSIKQNQYEITSLSFFDYALPLHYQCHNTSQQKTQANEHQAKQSRLYNNHKRILPSHKLKQLWQTAKK